MEEDIRTITHNAHIIHILPDNDPQNPRDWDNLGTIIAFHRRYNLGDKHDYRSDDFSGWDAMQAQILKDNPGAVILPLYMYDHSCVALSTGSFIGRAQHAEWDSGRVGFILATRERIKEFRGWDRLTAPRILEIQKSLSNEIDVYSKYINGESYGYVINEPGTEGVIDSIDSCWGYFDIDDCIQAAMECIPA